MFFQFEPWLGQLHSTFSGETGRLLVTALVLAGGAAGLKAAQRYLVVRSENDNTGPYDIVDYLSGTETEDLPPVQGKLFYYRVAGITANGPTPVGQIEAPPDNRLALMVQEMTSFGRSTGEAELHQRHTLGRPAFDYFA